ncbi:MAG: Phenylacetic acid catabolic protein, partial [Thermoplasmatota archaeon]
MGDLVLELALALGLRVVLLQRRHVDGAKAVERCLGVLELALQVVVGRHLLARLHGDGVLLHLHERLAEGLLDGGHLGLGLGDEAEAGLHLGADGVHLGLAVHDFLVALVLLRLQPFQGARGLAFHLHDGLDLGLRLGVRLRVALDLLGQARLWLGYAGEVEARLQGRGRSEDELAFLRDGSAYRKFVAIVEAQGGRVPQEDISVGKFQESIIAAEGG